MKKRLLTFLFLFLISVQAMAIAPVIWAIGTVMAETSIGVQVSAAALVVGGAIYSLGISRTGNSGEARTDTLYMTNAPRPASVAEAAAGFTAGYPHVSPPSSKALSNTYYAYNAPSLVFSTAQEACNNYRDIMQSTRDPAIYGTFTGVLNFPNCTIKDPWNGTIGSSVISVNENCSVGYTKSGGSCVLSAPDSVPRPTDGFCPILRSGNSYGTDTTDPDCASATATPQFNPDGSYSIESADGRFVRSRLTSGGDRVTTIGTPDPATSTTKIIEITTRQTTDPAVPPTVIGKKEGILPGIGAPADPLPVVTPPPAVTIDLTPVTAAIAAQAAADAAARAADTAAAAAATTAAGGNLTGSENSRAAADASSLAGMNTLANAAKSGYDTDKMSLSNIFSFAPVASVCAPYTKTVHGRTVTIDTCYYTEMIRTTLAWLFALFGAYTTFTNIFRPRT